MTEFKVGQIWAREVHPEAYGNNRRGSNKLRRLIIRVMGDTVTYQYIRQDGTRGDVTTRSATDLAALMATYPYVLEADP